MVAVVVFSFLLVLPGSQLLTVGFPHRSHADRQGGVVAGTGARVCKHLCGTLTPYEPASSAFPHRATSGFLFIPQLYSIACPFVAFHEY